MRPSFYSDLSRRLDAFAASQRGPQGLDFVLRTRVKDARWEKAVFIDGASTIEQAGHAMQHTACNSLFVTDGERTGIVTGMNISKAVILRRIPLETPVRDICRFEVAAVDSDDFIFEALLAMTRSKKRRIAIRQGKDYAGVLEDIDILELFAGNSQLIPGRIDRARTVADLTVAAQDIQGQVERLHEQGVKIDVIAEITSDLNRNLLAKLFDMVAPRSVRDQGCLIVMGWEGRREQTVRTDQDNGLLLGNEIPQADLASFVRLSRKRCKPSGSRDAPETSWSKIRSGRSPSIISSSKSRAGSSRPAAIVRWLWASSATPCPSRGGAISWCTRKPRSWT